MTRSTQCVLAASIVALIGAASAPRLGARQRDTRVTTAAPPAGTGVLAGTVSSADGPSHPIRGANVVLIGTLTGTLRVMATDSAGRFSFADLPADRYLVGASKPPYLGAVAGAKRPARPGVPVALGDGQRLMNVSVQLPMGASISGVLTDERGQPAANANVSIQQWRMQNGERTLVAVPGAVPVIDERGHYRIYALAPGDYVVSATRAGFSSGHLFTEAAVTAALANPAGAAAFPIEPPARYTPIFYPGTPRSGEATTLTVATGEERQGVDIRIDPVRSVKVDGVVSVADGELPAAGSVILSPIGAGGLASATRWSASGAFAFPSVTPGSYTITAMFTPLAGRGGGPPAAAVAPQFGSAIVEVGASDLQGAQVILRPATPIAGHAVFTGATTFPAAGRQMPIKMLGQAPAGLAGAQTSLLNAAGEFSISRITPGRYVIGGPLFFGANADSVTWALESVAVDGRDVTDRAIEIQPDKMPKDIVVTYSDRWQQLSGKLQQATGAPVSDYTLVVFPADKTYWISGSRRILVTRPGTDGLFTFGGPGLNTLPPGSYLLAAVTDIDRDEQFDPAFLTTLMQAGTPVVINAGERKVQDLAIR